MMVPLSSPTAAPPVPASLAQTCGARTGSRRQRGAQVNHELAGLDQLQLLVDLFDLVGRPRAKALFLGQSTYGSWM